MILQTDENHARNPQISVDGTKEAVRMNPRFCARVPEPFAENHADISQGVSVVRENQKAHPDWHPNGPDHSERIRFTMAKKPIQTGATAEQALAHLRRCAAIKDGPARPPRTDGYAYFIGPKDGPVKIGFSTNPQERLYRLQTDHPARLFLWAEAEGGEKQERAYHARFGSAWLGGEWFTRTPEIEAEIARLVEQSEAA